MPSMWSALAFLIVSILSHFLYTKSSTAPVCIVGAGPAGLSAASRLETKGYKTILFDKELEVGGKCQAYYENGVFHPLGAVLFSNDSYQETVKMINAAGIASTAFPGPSEREPWKFNWTTGETSRPSPLGSEFGQALAAEIPRYAALWQKVFAPLSVAGYKNGVPAELTVPTSEWMNTNGFEALQTLMVSPIGLYGYGDIRVVPILYTLQYMTPDLVTMFLGQHPAYIIDYHAVLAGFAKTSIKGKIKTNTEVTSIDRSGAHPIIRYMTQGAYRSRQQKCSDVIVAFPPTISTLQEAGINLTKAEREVFNAVGVHNYYSAAVKLNIPANVSFSALSSASNIPPENAGEPVLFSRLNPNSDIATAWSWGPYREFQSEAYAKELLKTTISKFNKNPKDTTALSTPVTDGDVRAFRKWAYFPHFDSQQLREGWYDKFNKLQGNQRTYWASGLNSFETVEWAVRAGLDIADSYF